MLVVPEVNVLSDFEENLVYLSVSYLSVCLSYTPCHDDKELNLLNCKQGLEKMLSYESCFSRGVSSQG